MARMPVNGVRTSWANTAKAASTTPREDVRATGSRAARGTPRATEVTWGALFLSSLAFVELALVESGLVELALTEFVLFEFVLVELLSVELLLADPAAATFRLADFAAVAFALGEPDLDLPDLVGRAWRPAPRFRTRFIMALLT